MRGEEFCKSRKIRALHGQHGTLDEDKNCEVRSARNPTMTEARTG